MKPTMKQRFGGLVGVVLALGALPGAGAALPTGKPAPRIGKLDQLLSPRSARVGTP